MRSKFITGILIFSICTPTSALGPSSAKPGHFYDMKITGNPYAHDPYLKENNTPGIDQGVFVSTMTRTEEYSGKIDFSVMVAASVDYAKRFPSAPKELVHNAGLEALNYTRQLGNTLDGSSLPEPPAFMRNNDLVLPPDFDLNVVLKGAVETLPAFKSGSVLGKDIGKTMEKVGKAKELAPLPVAFGKQVLKILGGYDPETRNRINGHELYSSEFNFYRTARHDIFTEGYELSKTDPRVAYAINAAIKATGINVTDSADVIISKSPLAQMVYKEIRGPILSILLDQSNDKKAQEKRATEIIFQSANNSLSLSKNKLLEAKLLQEPTTTQKIKLSPEELSRYENQISEAGKHAGVQLISTIIGIQNPELGKKLFVLGESAIAVSKATETFIDVINTNMSQSSKAWAGINVTNGYLALGMAAINLFTQSDSFEASMMKQMQSLMTQLYEMQVQLNERFDRLEKRLDHLEDLVARQFRQTIEILGQIQTDQKNIKSQLESIRHQLERLEFRINDIDENQRAAERSAKVRKIQEGMDPCSYRFNVSRSASITAEKFRNCLTGISSFVNPDDRMHSEGVRMADINKLSRLSILDAQKWNERDHNDVVLLRDRLKENYPIDALVALARQPENEINFSRHLVPPQIEQWQYITDLVQRHIQWNHISAKSKHEISENLMSLTTPGTELLQLAKAYRNPKFIRQLLLQLSNTLEDIRVQLAKDLTKAYSENLPKKIEDAKSYSKFLEELNRSKFQAIPSCKATGNANLINATMNSDVPSEQEYLNSREFKDRFLVAKRMLGPNGPWNQYVKNYHGENLPVLNFDLVLQRDLFHNMVFADYAGAAKLFICYDFQAKLENKPDPRHNPDAHLYGPEAQYLWDLVVRIFDEKSPNNFNEFGRLIYSNPYSNTGYVLLADNGGLKETGIAATTKLLRETPLLRYGPPSYKVFLQSSLNNFDQMTPPKAMEIAKYSLAQSIPNVITEINVHHSLIHRLIVKAETLSLLLKKVMEMSFGDTLMDPQIRALVTSPDLMGATQQSIIEMLKATPTLISLAEQVAKDYNKLRGNYDIPILSPISAIPLNGSVSVNQLFELGSLLENGQMKGFIDRLFASHNGYARLSFSIFNKDEQSFPKDVAYTYPAIYETMLGLQTTNAIYGAKSQQRQRKK